MAARNIEPEFSKGRVNKAGRNVRSGTATDEDIKVIENWRAAHNKILNDWQATLRGRCRGKNITFAQRLKRRSTIFNKLKRQPDMELARMHDIAGCRLIFSSIAELEAFREELHKSWMKHKRRKANTKPYAYDYIHNPHRDNSGYRGIHDIYTYNARPGRVTSWNGLLVEIQYRTAAQHAWATANEIAGSLTGNHSKFGRGEEGQKEFFRLASEIIARSSEDLTSCYPDKSNAEVVRLFNQNEENTHLLRKLQQIRMVSEQFDFTKQNVILVHDEAQNNLTVYSYKTLPTAQEKYFELEKQHGDAVDIVLVRAPSEESLRQAYKNYFSDAADFVKLVDDGLRNLT